MVSGDSGGSAVDIVKKTGGGTGGGGGGNVFSEMVAGVVAGLTPRLSTPRSSVSLASSSTSVTSVAAAGPAGSGGNSQLLALQSVFI